MLNELEKLYLMTKELKKTKKITLKKHLLKQNPDLALLLRMIYSPWYKFNIQVPLFKKQVDVCYDEAELKEYKDYSSIRGLLSDLHHRKIIGKKAIRQALFTFDDDRICNVNFDFFCDVLNKNLKCGINISMIHDVFKGGDKNE